MSNVALFSPDNVPAFARKGELSALAKSLAGGTGGGGKRISIKGGVFRLMVDGKEVAAIDERFLDVVVVAAAPKIGRTFYAKAYDGDAPSGPDCWSADGEKPDATAADPQSDRCATCPQNVRGSGAGESRACRFSQRLAVVLANDVKGDVMQLQLPATSIWDKDAKGEDLPLQAYARRLAAQGVSPETLVTRMKFDTKSEAPKLFFRPVKWLTEDEYEVAVEKGQSDEAKRAVTMTVAQTDKVAPLQLEGTPPVKAQEAPSAPKRGRPAKPKVEEPAAEEEDVEPVVKKEEKPAPPAKPSLASLADQWDDE